jgi:hypothetical protein
MTTKNGLLIALLLAVLPQAVQAGDMSYTYVDLAYVHLDQDNRGTNDGAALRGSLGIAENFLVFAEYVGFPRGNASNLNLYSAGIGGHFGLTDKMHVVGRIGWAGADVRGSSESGYVASLGLRGQPNEHVEIEGHVIHTDFGSAVGDETEIAVAGRYFISDRVAVGLEFRASLFERDQEHAFLAGVRFAF